MAFLTMLSAGLADSMTPPGGMWEWLILHLFDFVGNYGWRIIVFTVLLKLVLLPLDIYQKYCMRKNQKITERLKPEMEKLQKAYGDDKQAYAQKQMELNKREGFSYFSSCLPMIFTLIIFIWLWRSMTTISQYMILKQYVEWNDRFNMVQGYVTDEDFFREKPKLDQAGNPQTDEAGNPVVDPPDYTEADEPRIMAYVTAAIENYNRTVEDKFKVSADDPAPGMGKDWGAISGKAIADHVAGQAVADFYAGDESNREGFLWIANVWTAEVFWKKPIGDATTFVRSIGDYAKNAQKIGVEDVGTLISSDRYALVTGRLAAQEDRPNGYLILPILSVGLSFLSYFISTRQQKKAGQQMQGGMGGGAMKFMMILMPLMMGFFALSYSSAFTLYIVVNSATSILVNVASSLLLNVKDKIEERKAAVTVQRYGRPDPNAGNRKKK